MRKDKNHEEEHENHERWLLSYADFITLLMIFFIIMYAISNVDKEKYRQVAAGLSAAMGGGSSINIIDSGSGESDPEVVIPEVVIDEDLIRAEEEEKNLEEVKGTVDKYLEESGLSDSVETIIEERGLVLSFKDSLFFDSAKAEVKSGEVRQLTEIGKILNQAIISDSLIRVEGHTDNIPIRTERYKSNWDLSVIRASNVAQILINDSGIEPSRISVVGYGEYRPKADNNTEAGRAANRRVDILIMNSEYNEVENNSN